VGDRVGDRVGLFLFFFFFFLPFFPFLFLPFLFLPFLFLPFLPFFFFLSMVISVASPKLRLEMFSVAAVLQKTVLARIVSSKRIRVVFISQMQCKGELKLVVAYIMRLSCLL